MIKSALSRAIEDTEADGGTPTPVASPTPINPDDLEAIVFELVGTEKWSAVVSFVKHHREHLLRELDLETTDDVYLILNIFCKKIVLERNGLF